MDQDSDDQFTAEVAAAAVYQDTPGGDVWPDEYDDCRPSAVVRALADGELTELGERERLALRIMLGVLNRNTERRKAATTQLAALRHGRSLATGLPVDPETKAQWRRQLGELRLALNNAEQERDRNARLLDKALAVQAAADERVKAAREVAAERRGCGKVPLLSTAEAWLFIEKVCLDNGEEPSKWNVYPCETCRWPSTSPHAGRPVWHAGHVATRAEREAAALAERTGGERLLALGEAAARLGLAKASPA